MNQTRGNGESGGKAAFRLRALLRAGVLVLAAAVVAVAVLVFDDVAFSGSTRSDPRKLRTLFAVVTAIPLACAAASFFEFICGVPFGGLEERWRVYRRRRMVTWLVLAAALTLPLLLAFLFIWLN